MPVTGRGSHVIGRYNGTGEIHMNTSTLLNAANNAGENVNSMHLSAAVWSTSNGAYFTVARGANVVGYYEGAGQHDYQSLPVEVSEGDRTANVVITKVGTGPCMLVLKLHKKVTIT
jgi:hypothetical protein